MYESERHWQQTLEVASTLRTRRPAENDGTPTVGELYLSRRTADFPVEWLVIESVAGRLRLVPVDDYPLTGSRDVELTRVGGVAVARCGYSDWVDVHTFEPELRTDVVDAGDLERAQAKRRSLDDDGIEATLLEEVVDGDPEYQRLCEGTLAPAIDALSQVDNVVWMSGLQQHWRPIVFLAAMLTLMLSFGYVTVDLKQELGAAQTRLAEVTTELAELEDERPEQQARVDEQVRLREASEAETERVSGLLSQAESALADVTSSLDTMTRRFEQARQAIDLGATADVRKLVFGGEQRSILDVRRGLPLTIRSGSSLALFMELEVVNPEPYLVYRARFVPKQGEDPIVTIERLDRNGSWLRFILETDKLPVGEYLILIDGVTFGGETVELDERYQLTVEP